MPLRSPVSAFAANLSGREIAGIGIAFFGVLFVVFNGVFVLKLNPLGDMLALAAAFCWALYGFLAKRIMDRYDTFLGTRKLMFYGIVTASPLLLPEKGSLAGIRLMNFNDFCGLAYLGLICSAFCYLMWNEAVTWGGAVGVVLVVGGMLLSSLKS